MSDKKLSSLAVAEHKAQKIIKEANARKTQLIGQAGAVADKELKQLRARMQQELDRKVFDTTEEEENLARKTEEEIAQVFQAYEQNGERVLEFVTERLVSVDIQINKNVVADFEALKTGVHE